ncbi:MAG: c-type cytochrome [Salinisphaera sp.]|nr:c-type cytochrome [Salinisphaera sp.]
MHKMPFFAALILVGATMAIALAGCGNTGDSGGTDHSNGKMANSGCPPDNWTALDLNQDGYANEDEVKKAAPCLDFAAVDASGDGHFSRVEFLNFQEGKAKGEDHNANESAGASADKSTNSACAPDNWTALDLNQDGYAHKDEVKKAASCIDFAAVDTSGDGDLSRVEFLNFQEGKSNATSSASEPRVNKPDAGQNQAQESQHSGNAQAIADQSQYDTPLALITNVPKGQLRNPFDPHNTAITKQGKQLFASHGCSGCHGGDGGGGMCPPLTDEIWSYGGKPDTLYRLITLGTKKLQSKYGLTRNMMQAVQGAMPAVGPTFDNTEDVWKVVTWVESMHMEN